MKLRATVAPSGMKTPDVRKMSLVRSMVSVRYVAANLTKIADLVVAFIDHNEPAEEPVTCFYTRTISRVSTVCQKNRERTNSPVHRIRQAEPFAIRLPARSNLFLTMPKGRGPGKEVLLQWGEVYELLDDLCSGENPGATACAALG